MDRLIDKARRDLEFRRNTPRIENILTLRGFMRYFFYRNSLPFVRDVSYTLINLIQIIFILKLLGLGAATGGVIGYAFMLFVTDFWDAIKYSLREKILTAERVSGTEEVSKYFVALVAIGTVIWLLVMLVSLSLVKIDSTGSYVIFVSTIASAIFQLLGSSYFMATYTISRVYIPISYTMGSRVLNLLLGIVLMKFIGAYGVCFSLFSSGIMDFLITKHFCDKTLGARNIKLIPKRIRLRKVYESSILLLQPVNSSLKRLLVFTLVSADKLVLIILVHYFYESYVVDFFLMYQLIQMFMLIPARVSKSLYFDTVMLLKTRALSMLRLLFNRNLVVVIMLGFVFAYLFSLLPYLNLPHRHWSSLILDLTILDKWAWVYTMIFCYFIIRFINRFLLFSESYLSLVIPYIFFEYILALYLLFGDKYFLETKEILIFFPIKGQVGLYYCGALLLIYFTGIWKKESLVLSFKGRKSRELLLSHKEFKDELNKYRKDDSMTLLILEKDFAKPFFMDQILASAQENTGAFCGIRLSFNAMLFINRTEIALSNEQLKLKAVEHFGVYCREIFTGTRQELVEFLTSKSGQQNANPYRAVINVMYPKLFSDQDDIEKNGIELEQALKVLSDNKIEYRLCDVRSDMGSKYLNNVIKDKERTHFTFNFLKNFELNGYRYIDVDLNKAISLGVVPVIKDGELRSFIYINEPSGYLRLLRKLVRNFLYLNLLELLKND